MTSDGRSEKILVTGAAGFIGSTLVDRLLQEGREVVGLDNFDPFYAEDEKRRNLALALDCEGFELVNGDIRDAALLDRVFASHDFDAVVHLAALAGVRPSLERPADYADVNVTGTTRVLDAARRHGGPRIVQASSSSVYGERRDGPFRESDRVDHPVSPYASTKKAAELVAHTFHHLHGLSVTSLRLFTVYGPRQRPDLAIRRFAERILRGESVPIFGDGSQVRDFTYVDDIVDGCVRSVDTDLGYALLNLGAGRTISLMSMVGVLEEALGSKADLRFEDKLSGDVTRTWADIRSARDLLGYDPRTTFSDGIRNFASWLQGARTF